MQVTDSVCGQCLVVAKVLYVELGKVRLNLILLLVSHVALLIELIHLSKPQLPCEITVKIKYVYERPIH